MMFSRAETIGIKPNRTITGYCPWHTSVFAVGIIMVKMVKLEDETMSDNHVDACVNIVLIFNAFMTFHTCLSVH